MELNFEIGLNVISSYRRLSYTPWHAIAEFVDNSTQNFLNNKTALEASHGAKSVGFEIGILYDREAAKFSIADNAMGMDLEELRAALRVGIPPANPDGRSKYGMGMKTAACWIGDRWTVRTTRLGSPVEFTVEVDVRRIEKGNSALTVKERSTDVDKHYTVLEIDHLNKPWKTRTLGKIRKYLESMYRKDFEQLGLTINWQSSKLGWEGFEDQLLKNRVGEDYKQEFEFEVDDRKVWGWGGILERGSRTNAGFSMFQNSRVIRGWPDAWRPAAIFGDARNDLINQRLVGEIHLDGFDVSHTKDDILLSDDQEQDVEQGLKTRLSHLIAEARDFRKKDTLGGGPSDGDVDKAVSALKEEIQSEEIVEQIEFEDIPDVEAMAINDHHITEQIVEKEKPAIVAKLGPLTISAYLVADLSPNDPYVVLDSADTENIIVVINFAHPYVRTSIEGQSGVLNYLRHCIYDAVAEARARQLNRPLDSQTVKLFKDRLLRVPFQMIESDFLTETGRQTGLSKGI